MIANSVAVLSSNELFASDHQPASIVIIIINISSFILGSSERAIVSRVD